MGNGVQQLATDPFAAMPSLHAADALIVGRLGHSVPEKILWLLWFGWLCFCVIATGNHFWLDVVVEIGVGGVALVAIRAAEWLPARRRFAAVP